jgi:hypothetical protein
MSPADTNRFEIRDEDLPDRPPLAVTADYPSVPEAVARLHEAFHTQLDANGEDATALVHREHRPRYPPRVRCLSFVGGHHWPGPPLRGRRCHGAAVSPDEGQGGVTAATGLTRHGCDVESVFDLLGRHENDLTAALGFTLARSPELRREVAARLLPDAVGPAALRLDDRFQGVVSGRRPELIVW